MGAALDGEEGPSDNRVDLLLSVVNMWGGDARATLRPMEQAATFDAYGGGGVDRVSPLAFKARSPILKGTPPVTPKAKRLVSSSTEESIDLAEQLDDAASVGESTASQPSWTKELIDLLRGSTGPRRSTIQVKPDIAWPSLADSDQDIETFFEELEDVCDLANDASGMSDVERLRCLGNCLKQSRKKVYRVQLKEARRSGLLRSDPGAVYELLRTRLMEFRETLLERQNRYELEYGNLAKGSLTALQFLPLFESVTSEMDLCGVGLSERQMLLGYLRKVGTHYRQEILKDRRFYPAPGGGPDVTREVKTWREGHRILLEMESVTAGSKALVAAVGDSPPNPKKAKRSKTGKAPPAVNAVDSPGRPGICFRARDFGTCDRGANCHYDHDPARLNAARKEKAAKEAGQSPRQAHIGHPKSKEEKAKKGKKSETHGKPKELCLRFMRGECSRSSQECKFSHAAKQINAVLSAVDAAQSKGFLAGATGPSFQNNLFNNGYLPDAQAAAAAGSNVPPAAATVAAATAPPQPPGLKNALKWIRPGVLAIFAGAQAPSIASTGHQLQLPHHIKTLDDLPLDVWRLVPEPPPGYHFRTLATIGKEEIEVLLDGGAVFSLLSEEFLVYLINAAVSAQLTPDSEEWPLAGLEHWGADSAATTVSNAPALLIRAVVLLRLTLVSLRGERRRIVTRVRVVRRGFASAWRGLILGAPFCDVPPLGMGHTPRIGGHYFKALKILTTRLEDKTVQSALEGQMVAACRSVRHEWDEPCLPTLCDIVSVESCESGLPLYALASELLPGSVPGDVLTGGLVGAVSADAAPILLDTDDEVSLEMGESAWVPAVALVAPAFTAAVPAFEVETNLASVVHAMPGVWNADEGLLLIANFSQPNVTLSRGDVIGAARVASDVPPLTGETDDDFPSVCHVQRQEEELQRLYELDLPHDGYYA
ncbi:MAG TPA: hypothetical protein EYP98_13775, partial [Planctomycetes bacterium]|nr:hypothetical protein [Planctomycetota bacterium]